MKWKVDYNGTHPLRAQNKNNIHLPQSPLINDTYMGQKLKCKYGLIMRLSNRLTHLRWRVLKMPYYHIKKKVNIILNKEYIRGPYIIR